MAQNWFNNDGLFLQFGTDKAIPETGGEYRTTGPNRLVEVLIDLSKLNTSTATILSYTTKFPAMANGFIEKVEVIAEVAMSTTSSPTLSVGVIGEDQATVPTNGGTAFVKAAAASTLSHEGDMLTLTYGSTAAGDHIGASYEDTTVLNAPMYLTAILGTATATGIIRVRVYYRGVGTITQ